MPIVNLTKNRDRELPSFANLNLLGRCNCDCYFCLGKDIAKEIAGLDCLATPVAALPRLPEFLDLCRAAGIPKIYVTGQNTDSLLYRDLRGLVTHLRRQGFFVGIRTNGYRALARMQAINRCDSVGYSLHTFDPVTSKMMTGCGVVPDWSRIFAKTTAPFRVSMVLTRCNRHEFFSIVQRLACVAKIRYIQVRRVSTDTRVETLFPDMVAYEEVYSIVRDAFRMVRRLHGDAESYDMYGKEVVFWRTVKTSVSSYNWFSDGTISTQYFIVEGYKEARGL